uniref:Wsv313-like protein n=1 Tax=Penaeus semisulcatus majanivirus TaxID=2984274 RepID=A0A9C7BVL7_9VIRU|nr:MAG: wsv313-like protein [Penaeus semisulcatus majanivirus]
MPISDSDENDDDEDDEDDNDIRRRENLYLANSDDDVDDDDDYGDFYDNNDYNDEINDGGNSNNNSVTSIYNDDVIDDVDDDDDNNNNNDNDANVTRINDEDDEFDNDNNKKYDNDNSFTKNENRDDSDEINKGYISDKNNNGMLEQLNTKSVMETDKPPSKNRFIEDKLEIAKSSKGYYDAYRLYKKTTSKAVKQNNRNVTMSKAKKDTRPGNGNNNNNNVESDNNVDKTAAITTNSTTTSTTTTTTATNSKDNNNNNNNTNKEQIIYDTFLQNIQDDYDIRVTEDINNDRSNTLQQSDSTNTLQQNETEHAENICDDPTDYRNIQNDDSDIGVVASQNIVDNNNNDDDHQNSLFKYLMTKYKTDSDGETSTVTNTTISTNFTNTVTTATAVDDTTIDNTTSPTYSTIVIPPSLPPPSSPPPSPPALPPLTINNIDVSTNTYTITDDNEDDNDDDDDVDEYDNDDDNIDEENEEKSNKKERNVENVEQREIEKEEIEIEESKDEEEEEREDDDDDDDGNGEEEEGYESNLRLSNIRFNILHENNTPSALHEDRERKSRQQLKEQSLHQLIDNINDNLRPNIKKGLQETKLAIEDVNMKLLEEHTQHLKCNAVVTALFKKRREAIRAGVVVDDLPPLPSADQIERLRKTITVELMIRKLEECKKVNCVSKANVHEVNITLLTTMQENQLLCNPIFDKYARVYHHNEDDNVTFQDKYDTDACSLRLEANTLDERRFDDEYEKLEYYTNLLNRLLKLKTESLHQWLFTTQFLRQVIRGVVKSITSENDGKRTTSCQYDSDESYDMGSYNNNSNSKYNNNNNTIPTRENNTCASEFFWYSGVELFFSFINDRIQSYITGVSKDIAELAIQIGIPLIMIRWTGSFKTSKTYKSLLKRSINNVASIIIEPSLFILGNMLKENRNDDAKKWTTSKTKRAIGDLADRHSYNILTIPKNIFLHNYKTVDPDALTLTTILEKDISVGRDIRKHIVSYLYKNRKTFSMLLVRGILEIKKSASSLVARYIIDPPSSLSSSSVLPSRTSFSSTESDLDVIANHKRSSSNVRKRKKRKKS